MAIDTLIFDMDGTTVRHVNPRLLHALELLEDADAEKFDLFRNHELWRGSRSRTRSILESRFCR